MVLPLICGGARRLCIVWSMFLSWNCLCVIILLLFRGSGTYGRLWRSGDVMGRGARVSFFSVACSGVGLAAVAAAFMAHGLALVVMNAESWARCEVGEWIHEMVSVWNSQRITRGRALRVR